MDAAGERVSLNSKSGRQGHKGGWSHAVQAVRGSRRMQKRGTSAPGGGGGGFRGSDEDFDPELDDLDDSLGDEDLDDMDSLAGSNAEQSVLSDEEEEDDIEQVLAAMEAEADWLEDWPDEDSEEDISDSDVPDAENMDAEELQAAREERRQAKQKLKDARKIAKREAWREAKILAHEEKVKAKCAHAAVVADVFVCF